MKIKTRIHLFLVTLFIVLAFALSGRATETAGSAPAGKPEAAIDLATEEGAKLVRGAWRYSDTKIVEVDFKAPGLDKQPTGAPIKSIRPEAKAKN
jgi:hypothetical protein